MKITKPNLLKALEFPASIIKQRATIPILACVRLVAANNTFTVSACDCDQFCQSMAECEGELADICVSASAIKNILPILGDEIEVTLKGSNLVFTSNGSVSLPTQSADDFPAWEFGQQKAIGLNCADLAKCIKTVEWASYKNMDTNPGICGVHVNTSAKNMIVEASNGRELAHIKRALIAADSNFVIMLPFVDNTSKALFSEGAVLSLSDRKIKVKWDGGLYSCKLPEQPYPNTAAYLSGESTHLGEIEPSQFKPFFQTVAGMDVSQPWVLLSESLIEHSGAGGSIYTPTPSKLAKCEIRLNGAVFLNCLNSLEDAPASFSHNQPAVIFEQGDLTVLSCKLRNK